MASTIPKGIAFKVTNGREGQYVKATNITSGGTMTGKLNSNKECVLNPAKELGSEWSENDKIQGSISGEINQCSVKTIKNGGCAFSFSNTATSSMSNVTM